MALCSCQLVQAPFRLVGGLVQGTAQVTEAAVTAPGKAMEERRKRKEKEAERREGGETPSLGSSPTLSGESPSLGGGQSLGSESPDLPDPPSDDLLLPPIGDE